MTAKAGMTKFVPVSALALITYYHTGIKLVSTKRGGTMSFAAQNRGRVGQSAYWINFGVNIALGVSFLGGGILALISGAYIFGILCMMMLLPVGIYFRVIMMRRCRDIGWPTFLPWLPFAFAMLFGFVNGLAASGDPRTLITGATATFGLSMIINLLDFAFMITIGCISSKSPDVDYVAIFGDDDASPRAAPAAVAAREISRPAPRLADPQSDEGDPDRSRWDAAIAARLAALSDPAEPAASADHQRAAERHDPIPTPRPAQRPPVSGFGRKVA
jgi:uncharacterized membrane protein YhaH (DUF805 family)